METEKTIVLNKRDYCLLIEGYNMRIVQLNGFIAWSCGQNVSAYIFSMVEFSANFVVTTYVIPLSFKYFVKVSEVINIPLLYSNDFSRFW